MSQINHQSQMSAICRASISKYSFNHNDIPSPNGLVLDPLDTNEWFHVQNRSMAIRLYSNHQHQNDFQIAVGGYGKTNKWNKVWFLKLLPNDTNKYGRNMLMLKSYTKIFQIFALQNPLPFMLLPNFRWLVCYTLLCLMENRWLV